MTKTLLQSLTVLFMITALPAAANEALSQEQLKALITGNTLYVTIPAGSPGAPEGGVAPIYYAPDNSAKALLPAGLKLIGTWKMAETGYCIDWENGPKNSCSTLVRAKDHFAITDLASGDPRGTVSKIATGNPENL